MILYHQFIWGDNSPSPPFGDRKPLVETPSTSGGKHRYVWEEKPHGFPLNINPLKPIHWFIDLQICLVIHGYWRNLHGWILWLGFVYPFFPSRLFLNHHWIIIKSSLNPIISHYIPLHLQYIVYCTPIIPPFLLGGWVICVLRKKSWSILYIPWYPVISHWIIIKSPLN
jgi:hypothetical protein